MQTWLVPGVIISLLGNVFLAAIFGYLYRKYSHSYLGIWAAGWLIDVLRFVLELVGILMGSPPWMGTVTRIVNLINGLFLFAGTWDFLGKRMSRSWLFFFGGGVVWTILADLGNLGFFLQTGPTALLLGICFLWTGWTILQAPFEGGFGKRLAGWAFILWGIHKFDFPLLRPHPELASLGFTLTGLLSIAVAFGFFFLFFERLQISLRESQARYRRYIDHAPIGIFIADPNGRYIDVNPASAVITGYSQDELLQRHMLELIPESAHAEAKDHFQKVLSAGRSVGELPFIHKSGEHRWWTVDAIQIEDQRFMGMVSDTTEQKRVREALRQSEARTRFMVENLPAGAIHVQGENLFLNRKAQELTGYSDAEIGTLDRWFHHMFGEEAMVVRQLYEEDRRQGFATSRVVPIRRKDQAIRWIEFAAFSDQRGEIWVLHDLTERREAEEAVRDRENRLRRLFDSIPDAVYLVDAEQRFLEANREACASLGYSKEELQRMKVPQITVEASAASVAERMQRADEQKSLMIQSQHRRRDGSTFPVEVHITPIFWGDQRAFLCLVRDMTERRRFEESLELARANAEAANLAKSQFMANMSHELRTPLNAIIGFSDLLLDMELPAKQREFLDVIRKRGDDLLILISEILDLTRIEADRLTLHLEPFSLRSAVSEAIAQTDSELRQKGLRLTGRVAADVPDRLVGDSLRLREVLFCLFSNAIKFTPQGEVEYLIQRVPGKDGLSTVSDPSGLAVAPAMTCLLEFSVRDTGIGIPPEYQKQIFEPFTQGDGSVTRRFGGAGVGLTIARRLVELMGGKIWFQSVPGQGSTFFVTLRFEIGKPETVANVVKPIASSSSPSLSNPDLRVLIVEDDVASQYLMKYLTSGFAQELVFANDGLEALRILEKTSFDLILMDLQMPTMDGYEATTRIRAMDQERGTRTPIIALTAFVMKGDQERCLKSGMDGYLTKPVSRDRLLREVNDVLAKLRIMSAQAPRQ